MNSLTRFVLAFVYLLVLPLRWWHNLRGYDRLRLKRPQTGDSYWSARDHDPDVQSYFLERSVAEGSSDRGAGMIATLLRLLAKMYAPPREVSTSLINTAEREQGIPDEIYTLW
jgi:hypothetical protein